MIWSSISRFYNTLDTKFGLIASSDVEAGGKPPCQGYSPNQLDRFDLIAQQNLDSSGYTNIDAHPVHVYSIFEAEASNRDRDAPVAFNAQATEYRLAPALLESTTVAGS